MSEELKPVLIAGAGPTGMMAAIELSRFNIPDRLSRKESKQERLSSSNNGVWVRRW
jgi:2-polyprenyl-6-methoxyphenol hydroxylase-like FAD-dependent oxidoreductase